MQTVDKDTEKLSASVCVYNIAQKSLNYHKRKFKENL